MSNSPQENNQTPNDTQQIFNQRPPIRPGTIETIQEDPSKFPFDAFTFSDESESPRVLTLDSNWDFAVDGNLTVGVDLDVTGDITCADVDATTGTITTLDGTTATFDKYEIEDSGTHLTKNATYNTAFLTTPTGTLEFGPRNASYCHFNTDRARFYFYKPIQSAYGRTPTKTYRATAPTSNALFDQISADMPTTGDKLIVTGGFYEANLGTYTTYIVSHAERISSTVIRFYYLYASRGTITAGGYGSRDATNGSSSQFRDAVNLAW